MTEVSLELRFTLREIFFPFHSNPAHVDIRKRDGQALYRELVGFDSSTHCRQRRNQGLSWRNESHFLLAPPALLPFVPDPLVSSLQNRGRC
jgi:hypothetical protein